MLIPTNIEKAFLDEKGISEVLNRIARQLLESIGDPQRLLIVGIQPHGMVLAKRIATIVGTIVDDEPALGCLALAAVSRNDSKAEYRLEKIELPVLLDEHNVVVVDTVVKTGHRASSAFAIIENLGNPASLHLAILADEGTDGSLIRGDYIGKTVMIGHDEEVVLYLKELDGFDAMIVRKKTRLSGNDDG